MKMEPMPNPTTLSIGQVARKVGIAASAIRFYESRGLLPEPSRQGGKRRYNSDILTQLRIIQLGQDAGFTLKEIEVLSAGIRYGGEEGPLALAQLATQKLPEIDAHLLQLQRMKKLLTAATQCKCPDLATCAAFFEQNDSTSPLS